MRSTSSLASIFFAGALACGDNGGDTGGGSATTTQGTTTMSTTAGTTSATGQTSEPTTSAATDATTGGGGGPGVCKETCSKDADCTIAGQNEGYTCAGGVCSSGEALTCTSNDECDALFSGWVTPCTSQMECEGQVCISLEGMGRCAFAPGDGLTCDMVGMEEVQAMTIEGMAATVCGQTGTECAGGTCRNPCKSDAECFPDLGTPRCDADSGACECTGDADCAVIGAPALSKCNQGVCGCGTDADCVGDNMDACLDGVCGCSSAAVCTVKTFDGTVQSCG